MRLTQIEFHYTKLNKNALVSLKYRYHKNIMKDLETVPD